MNNDDFARRVIERLQNGKPYTLPEMTDDDYVVYYDSLRIPEELSYLDRCLNAKYPRPASVADYIREQEAKRVQLEMKLADIREWYADGLLSAADYERLTTEQNYTIEQKRALYGQVSRFIPRWECTGPRGDIYSITSEYGTPVYLRFNNGEWFRDNTPYNQN